MVAIVQSNPYQILSRKIGYSVGLENLYRNATELTNLYAEGKQVLLADWERLVTETFNRNKEAVEHIGNFFAELNLIKIYGKELHVLFALDVLSILNRYFGEARDKYAESVRVVLLQQILERDGDIFLNCLAACFERTQCRVFLESMIDFKWKRLTAVIPNPHIQAKVWELVSVRSPAAQMGKMERAKSSRFETRQTSPFERRQVSLFGSSIERKAEVPDSYLDKILPTRKGWAKDLDLMGDSGLSSFGAEILDKLAAIGLRIPSGAYVFWSYSAELVSLRISADQLDAPSLTTWEILQAISIARTGTEPETSDERDDYDALVNLIRTIYQLYRSGSATRGSIRHQLPLYVLKPVLCGICVAEKRTLPPINEVIKREITGLTRRFDVTNIRGTEGALVFRS